ncbi:hypothetical protein ACA29_20810 [Lederbergia galactosidilytica]|uniref:Uncharacterized protein n=1 Tax=Lederbergia galactosidilytica TaxID=217031 RepID=A0A0Q9XN53_9BACI|nr:hypothetical protein ACA29_20810 [Lederbergia galactosidilytica]
MRLTLGKKEFSDNIHPFNHGSPIIPITAVWAIKAPAIMLIHANFEAIFIMNGKKQRETSKLKKIPIIAMDIFSESSEMITTLSKQIKKSVAAKSNKTFTLMEIERLKGGEKVSLVNDFVTSFKAIKSKIMPIMTWITGIVRSVSITTI